VLRSHEQVLEGFDWPFGTGRYLATIFSASNYAGKTNNKAAYALISAAGASSMPSYVRSKGSCSLSRRFGLLRIVQYESEHIGALRVQQRNSHVLASLIYARREALRAAYAAVDPRRSGVLPASLWASQTKEVLATSFTLLPLRAQLLGEAHTSSSVNYADFLARFTLARPQLEPYYPLREHLLVLLFKVDVEETGFVSLKELHTVCCVLRRHFDSDGSLFGSADDLLNALGPVGGAARAQGQLSIMQACACSSACTCRRAPLRLSCRSFSTGSIETICTRWRAPQTRPALASSPARMATTRGRPRAARTLRRMEAVRGAGP